MLRQVLTGESWSEAVARPLVFGSGVYIRSTIFYVSYILICGIVLVNVAVAVLLEKMVDQTEDSPSALAEEEEEEAGAGVPSTAEAVGVPALTNAARDTLLLQLQQELLSAREEAARREERLLRAMDAITQKLSVIDSIDAMVKDSSMKRRERRAKGQHRAATRTPEEASAAAGAEAGAAAGADAVHLQQQREDRAQDGAHEPSRAGPGRYGACPRNGEGVGYDA